MSCAWVQSSELHEVDSTEGRIVRLVRRSCGPRPSPTPAEVVAVSARAPLAPAEAVAAKNVEDDIDDGDDDL